MKFTEWLERLENLGGRWMDEKLQIYFIKFDNMPEVINGVAGTSIKEIK